MPRGSANELHSAARAGSVERTIALLSRGVIDIDEGEPTGMNPLMIAAIRGHLRVVEILLEKGADVSAVDDDAGFSPLHCSAAAGQVAATKVLVKAGADLEAVVSSADGTPLHVAARTGHSEVVRVLIEAGANPNSLLGGVCVPLDLAAFRGHSEVAHQLIQECGIEGCGGESVGMGALRAAAEEQHVEIMCLLTSAGVVDTGAALIGAAGFGREASVKFLLQRPEWKASWIPGRYG